jgi:hypothetical protein
MSPLLTPDQAQIERELDKLLAAERAAQQRAGSHPGAGECGPATPPCRVLGMRSPTQRNWPEIIERGGRRFRVAWCTSELEIRERLDAIEADGGEGLVILTPLETTTLGGDIAARLPHGRLAQSDRWDVLRGAFRVRDVDPRLRGQRWLADLLIERAPVGGYAPAAGGTLDLDTAWRAFQEQVLGLPPGRADAAALLEWSLDVARLDRFASMPDATRREVAERLAGAGGPGAGLVLSAAAAGRGEDALPIGLVCGVVFGTHEPGPELREAAVRLEPLVGGVRVAPEAGQALAAAARSTLRRLIGNDPARARAVQARAAALLAEVRADARAALSPALDAGLDARMADAAAALAVAASSGNADDARQAWELAQHAAAHDRAEDRGARIERLRMAVRLACWLSSRRAAAPRNMTEAAAAYASNGGFADRARHALQSGDPIPELARAYAALREAASVRREDENRVFADILRVWNDGGAAGADPVPVERLLERFVAPLARDVPVLVLVLDGLSFATWRALANSMPRLGWTDLCPAGRTAPPAAVAVLPSVTQVSRTSLLCGALTRGDQSTERTGFAAHPGLLAASRAGRPPMLFHKADLGPGPELPAAVAEALANPRQRVVGVVHNAVDAQLAGSDQIELTWSAEVLRPLPALLRVARDTDRVLVVTGDHGHIIEDGAGSSGQGVTQRWRAAGPAGQGEVLLTGGRVLSPDGGNAIVAAWSERMRHATTRVGSHGGASPQEVLIPLAVLSASFVPVAWSEAPSAEPAWWRGSTESLAAPAPAAPAEPCAPAHRRRPAEPRQPELFVSPSPNTARNTPLSPAWVEALLASDGYVAQRRLAGRGVPADPQVRAVLCALSARGGRMSQDGLAQALAVPKLRVGGIVNAARRVLNLDQAQVLSLADNEVVLDERLLRTQFQLKDEA